MLPGAAVGVDPRPVVRPSGWWYLVAVALAVGGIIAGLMAVTRGFDDARDAGLGASAAAPGEDQPLSIPEPGGYTVAYSGPVVVRSTAEQAQLAESLRVTITPAGGGAPLPLRPYEGLNDLTEGDLQYVPLLTVRFEEAGDYLLRTNSVGLEVDQSAVIVSESPYAKLRAGLARAAALLALGLFLAVLTAVILGRTRARAKRAVALSWRGGPR